tara:strand:- start:2252 stop:2602 length:351 start_codon:yes stop_codon:yes gene_type:complete
MKHLKNCRIGLDGKREEDSLEELLARKRAEEQRSRMMGGHIATRITVPILHKDHILTAIKEFRRLADNLEEVYKSDVATINKLSHCRWHVRDAHLEIKKQASRAIGGPDSRYRNAT